ncbi:histidine phosphotransferase family protein [Vannielia litorea]|uniref:Histidine phosphotransferase ChpT n=1 Tax=Vannielia litorea TaxID=1217970 RepID=A0A1N6F4Y7_9RHOB|nr:histidine phosphotransferase family protein [Vannielia litorea]SIN90309.1 histidine phosphotransferase ChpT [Vannielia litorea]
MADEIDLAARLASRICHDLISPVGAIGNGVELLEMAGLKNSPELALVADSVTHAQGRIRFFRVAFGRAEEGQQVSAGEIADTLKGYLGGGRVQVDWPEPGPVSRAELRAVFLAINCLEVELAYGGIISVRPGWEVVAEAPRMRGEAEAWAVAAGGADRLRPALVQFSLLPRAVAALGRRLEVERGAERVALRF